MRMSHPGRMGSSPSKASYSSRRSRTTRTPGWTRPRAARPGSRSMRRSRSVASRPGRCGRRWCELAGRGRVPLDSTAPSRRFSTGPRSTIHVLPSHAADAGVAGEMRAPVRPRLVWSAGIEQSPLARDRGRQGRPEVQARGEGGVGPDEDVTGRRESPESLVGPRASLQGRGTSSGTTTSRS